MIFSKARLALVATASITATVLATPAVAGGCNGVVNPFVWGCAPWDSNNGPQFPYYKAPKITIPGGESRIQIKNGAKMIEHQGKWLPVIAAGGGNVIAAGGLN